MKNPCIYSNRLNPTWDIIPSENEEGDNKTKNTFPETSWPEIYSDIFSENGETALQS